MTDHHGYISTPVFGGVEYVGRYTDGRVAHLLQLHFRPDVLGQLCWDTVTWVCDSPEQAAALEAAINGVIAPHRAGAKASGAELASENAPQTSTPERIAP